MATTYDLLSVMPGLQASANDVLIHEQQIVAKLQAQYPTLDLRVGSALRDTVIRPAAVHEALLAKALAQYDYDRMLVNASNSSDEALVDSMLSNFFLTRNLGTFARIKTRLRFHPRILNSGIETVTVDPSMFFSVDNINLFSPSDVYNLAVADMVPHVDGVITTYLFADITCQSVSQGDVFNLPAGTEFLYFSLVNNYFLGASLQYLEVASSSSETNAEFIARAPTAISTRNNINVPSISHNISTMPYVVSERSVGMGDYEMVRDYVEVLTPSGTLQAHRGGMVDVYVRTSVEVAVVQIPLTDPVTILTGLPPILDMWYTDEVPEFGIHGGAINTALLPITATPGNPIAFTDRNYLPGAAYESRVGLCSLQQLELGVAYDVGKCIYAKVMFWNGLDGIQSYLSSSENRMLCGNQICRGFAVVDLEITVYANGTDPLDDTLATSAQESCQSVVDGLYPGSDLMPIDLLSTVKETLPDVRLDLRIDLGMTLYDGTGSKYTGTTLSASEPVTAAQIVVLGGRTRESEEAGDKVRDAFVYHIAKVNLIWT